MWRWTGVNMLYFISGLKSIDTSLYESADIDGANAKQKFWYVTLPLLKPTNIVTPLAEWVNVHRSPTMRSKTFPGIAEAMATQWG